MNHRKSTSAFLTIMLAALLLSPIASFAQGTPPPPGSSTNARPHKWHRERHPEIRRALRHLRQAKNNLEHGSHDFQGHRAQALQLVDQAMEQLEEALKVDQH